MTNTIILIGFKHTGKTSIGKALAKKLKVDFIDLDQQIEEAFALTYHEVLSCRQIFHKYGEHFFRTMESLSLKKTLRQKKSVIALGGGTPIKNENQILLQAEKSSEESQHRQKKSTHIHYNPFKIIHVTSPISIVYDRIASSGVPAFFSPNEDPYHTFIRLWKEHYHIYQTLADYTINNDKTITDAVHDILKVITP
jgi:shikimate kinase